jgi:transposase InsO family protein
MEMASYLVAAVVVEGLSVRKVAKEHGVSKTWLYELVARYEAEGEAGLVPRSKRPHHSPTKVADRFENEIVRLRKELTEEGFDAGAETIRMHLRQAHRRAKLPSVSTIWRVLKARGFVVPEPHKRPRSSYARFEADLPNECWQMDVTHVLLANGREVEILNVIDDHSRLCVSSVALFVFKATDVVHTFYKAAGTWGLPAAVLSDNGAIFTAASRHGVCVMESELLSLGITYKHSRPYHPQTCGKVERFHQTMKKYLGAHKPARTIGALQALLDAFVAYYNTLRPHRAIGRKTPEHAFGARKKARPSGNPHVVPPHCRVRQDKVNGGNVTLRYKSDLLHLGVGRRHNGRSVLLLVKNRNVRILTLDGDLIRELTIDPTRNYQPQGC